MPKAKLPKQPAPRWWLQGEEQCPHCHQLYAYEIEVRCHACDGPSCPHCVTFAAGGIVCSGCIDAVTPAQDASHG